MLLWIIKSTVLVYPGFGLCLYIAQRSFIYFPVPENPADDARFEYLDSQGERLKIWVLGAPAAHAVLYFGGNAEDVYFNSDEFRRVLRDHTVYLVNYCGYGGSSGSPTQDGLFVDALNMFDVVGARHQHVSVIGRSLGSSIAIYLASERPVNRLVLITPYDSALAVARTLYPMYPVSLLLKDKYQNLDYAGRVRTPTLILTAGNDRIIPQPHSSRLAAAFATGLVGRVVIEGAGHNDLSLHREYWGAIARFLD